MAFAITGNLTSVLLNASNINIVSTSIVAFNQANFNTPRMIALFASGGVFKGIAYVRAWVSQTVLQLETPFFDPRTGLTVTQIIGEQILVSKNLPECITAGLAISGKNVTISDACTFGTAGQQLSLCLFDMDYNILTNSTLTMTGGVVCFGKLTNYQNNEYSGAIDIFSTQAGGANVLNVNGSSNAMFYGGLWSGINAPLYFSLGGNTGIFNSIECRADLVGGGNPNNVQLINANLNSTTTNTILCRVAATKILGGRFRFPNNTSNTISVFGNDSAGTYIVGALPNKRMVFEDNGNARALVRANTAVALNYDFTNFITQDFRSVTGVNTNLQANPNGRNRFFVQDSYTNLIAGSVAIFLNSSGGVEQSTLNSGNVFEPILHRKTCTGATVVNISTGWTYGFKIYGFIPTGGTIIPSLYNMGVLGTADNVVFGGLVNQIADTGVTLSNANALLLASKFTIATASNGAITVNSSTTLDELYDYLLAWNCQTIANAQFPTISTSPIVASGDNLTTNMTIVGLNFLAKGTKFKTLTANATQTIPTNLSNIELIGTLTYNTNTDITVTFTNCILGTVTNAGTGIVTIVNINSSITDYTDAQINFLDSTLSFTGISELKLYPTAIDRDNNTNLAITISSSPFNFKFGSIINGVTMSGTVYMRSLIGSTTQLQDKLIVFGSNTIDLTDNALLQSLSSNIKTVNNNVIKSSKFKTATEIF